MKGAPDNPRQTQPYPGLRLVALGYRSTDDELVRTVTVDIPLVFAVFIIMFLVVLVVLSWGQGALRGWLTFGCVASIMLALVTAFGLVSWFGMPFTQLQMVRATQGRCRALW